MNHAVANNERGSGLLRAEKELGDFLGNVLSIAIESECPGEAAGEGQLPTGLQGGTFATSARMADDFGASSFG